MHKQITYFDPRATDQDHPNGQEIVIVARTQEEFDITMNAIQNPEREITDIEIEEALPSVEELLQELASTDYKAIKYAEGWLTDEEYAPIKAAREDIREQIRQLQSE